MLLVILPGYIDLSIGSGVGLLGGISAVLLSQHNWRAPLAMLVAILAGVAIWFGMGALIVTQRIPGVHHHARRLAGVQGLALESHPERHDSRDARRREQPLLIADDVVFAADLGRPFGRGGVHGLQHAQSAPAPLAFLHYGLSVDSNEIMFSRLIVTGQLIALFVLVCNNYQGIPLSALILAAAVATWVLTQHTPFGRYFYAIGGNRDAAHVSGIPVTKIVIGTFAIMGFLVAIGGFMQTAYAGASTTTTGALLELDAITACVIGGTSLTGGRGNVAGVLFGSLIMASLLNGMTLMAMAPEEKFVARGLVLALAVWMDVRLNRGK